jgi:hypothetical protein
VNTAQHLIARWILYVMWSIGFFFLILLKNRIMHTLLERVAMTFNSNGLRWKALVMFAILGVYIGVLFVKTWSIHINYPMLIFVFIPTLMLNPLLGLWPARQFDSIPEISVLLGATSGCVLMYSLFNGTKNDIAKT